MWGAGQLCRGGRACTSCPAADTLCPPSLCVPAAIPRLGRGGCGGAEGPSEPSGSNEEPLQHPQGAGAYVWAHVHVRGCMCLGACVWVRVHVDSVMPCHVQRDLSLCSGCCLPGLQSIEESYPAPRSAQDLMHFRQALAWGEKMMGCLLSCPRRRPPQCRDTSSSHLQLFPSLPSPPPPPSAAQPSPPRPTPSSHAAPQPTTQTTPPRMQRDASGPQELRPHMAHPLRCHRPPGSQGAAPRGPQVAAGAAAGLESGSKGTSRGTSKGRKAAMQGQRHKQRLP